MNNNRLAELLAYAKVCFDHCTNPFETMHLVKKQVTADECKDLSGYIADIIDDALDYIPKDIMKGKSVARLTKEQEIEKAEKEFMETQI